MTADKRIIDQKLESLEKLRQEAFKGGGQDRIDKSRIAHDVCNTAFVQITFIYSIQAFDIGVAPRLK